MTWTWFHRLASPPHVYALATRLTPWFAWPAGALILAGAYGGLVLAPPDYQQGDGFRIIYVHAPSAWMSLMVYVTMAISAAVGLIWRMKVAHAVAASCAPIGASFTVAALVTGSLWGRPMWGTYWEWDPRLTSELILFFLYLGYMGLRSAIDDVQRADRASALLAVVGVVNVPIIHYSVVVELSASGAVSDEACQARNTRGDAGAAAYDADRLHAVLRLFNSGALAR